MASGDEEFDRRYSIKNLDTGEAFPIYDVETGAGCVRRGDHATCVTFA